MSISAVYPQSARTSLETEHDFWDSYFEVTQAMQEIFNSSSPVEIRQDPDLRIYSLDGHTIKLGPVYHSDACELMLTVTWTQVPFCAYVEEKEVYDQFLPKTRYSVAGPTISDLKKINPGINERALKAKHLMEDIIARNPDLASKLNEQRDMKCFSIGGLIRRKLAEGLDGKEEHFNDGLFRNQRHDFVYTNEADLIRVAEQVRVVSLEIEDCFRNDSDYFKQLVNYSFKNFGQKRKRRMISSREIQSLQK